MTVKDMLSRNIKDCPFCGGNVIFVQNSVEDNVTIGVHFDVPVALVLCASCAAAAGFYKITEDVSVREAEEKAIEAWNMRASDFDDDAVEDLDDDPGD